MVNIMHGFPCDGSSWHFPNKLKETLEKEGFEITRATTGDEIWEARHICDVIITAVALPPGDPVDGMNEHRMAGLQAGLHSYAHGTAQLIKALRADYLDVPFLVADIPYGDTSRIIEEFTKLGMNSYFDISRNHDRVVEYLRK